MLETIFAQIAPDECLFCAEQTFILCSECEQRLITPLPAVCNFCRARSEGGYTCPSCAKQAVRPTAIWAVTRFEEDIRRLVYKMKFDASRSAARYIAGKLNETVPWMDFDLVTYVPSAPARVRERGYDHARLIARELARMRGLDCVKLLERQGKSRQLGQSRAARRKQAQSAYRFYDPKRKLASVLLIDDVISTGATIEACTSLLRKNGVKKVYAACFGVN